MNPATLAKYREAFVPSRAKDDPTDAEIALELLLRHQEKLQTLKPQSADMRTLATLVEQRRDLVGDKTRITNRLSSTRKQYFPQALDWFEDCDRALFCDFLQRWPSLKPLKRARQATLRSFFWAHNLRRAPLIEQRIHGIRSASALTDDAAVIEVTPKFRTLSMMRTERSPTWVERHGRRTRRSFASRLWSCTRRAGGSRIYRWSSAARSSRSRPG